MIKYCESIQKKVKNLLILACAIGPILFSLAQENIVKQPKFNSCAIDAYNTICKIYDKKPNKIKLSKEEEERGVSMATLSQWFNNIGLETEGIRCGVEDIPKNGGVFVAHVNSNHYIIVTGKFENHVVAIDAQNPQYLVAASAFSSNWDGALLKVSEINIKEKIPIIVLDQKQLDLEKMAINESSTLHLRISNISPDKTLNIMTIATSCGCLLSKLEKKAIGPMETVDVHVSFIGKKEPGLISEKLIIATDDPAQPLTPISVKGVVVATNEFAPSLVNFGRLYSGKPISQNVRFIKNGFFSDSANIEINLTDNSSKILRIVGEISGDLLILTALFDPKTDGVNEGSISINGFMKGMLRMRKLDTKGNQVGEAVNIPICAILPI